MNYVFDTCSLSAILNHYYADRFPSFWDKFNQFAEETKIISVREVQHELNEKFDNEIIKLLLNTNDDFFTDPNTLELQFITSIYSITHFQHNLEKQKLLRGGPFADPFIIAKAQVEDRIVVTEEKFKPNGARIPNICKHFEIDCINLEGFLTKENWKF